MSARTTLAPGFLDDWVDRLRTVPGPPAVALLLRGSHARDAATEFSDVDLDLLVADPVPARNPAYLAQTGDRLVHVSVAVRDVESWLARLDQPAPWAFGLPVAAPARLLWADPVWRSRVDRNLICQPGREPELEDLVADLGKATGAFVAGDELGVRLAAADLARRCPSVLRWANPPVTVTSRRGALETALGLPVAPPGYRADLLACLGARPRSAGQLQAAAHRLVAGTLTLVRPYADQFVPAVGADLAAALADGRLARYVDQLGRRDRFPANRRRAGGGSDWAG
ncbi:nucleotidyltransferase domain-containing protein [Micromonospora zhanjiangensis]|uniref:Nucleotidyltransferase substrate binding domain-containing protein n=1 Tax=Micromonospora zhanjiangensis TaxID=1522057 RepID=A0ABV8KPR1_9ACTN